MSTRDTQAVRFTLAYLALGALLVGVTASFAPRTFYDDFPFVMQWVQLIPPYNDHLTTDVGGLQLAFGGLFAYAAWRPSRELVVPVCLAWAVSQALHLVFHLGHLDGFSTADAIGQTVALTSVTVLPLLPVAVLRRGPGVLRAGS